jgi:hypothetical protein
VIWLGVLIAVALVGTAAAYAVDATRPSMTPPAAPTDARVVGHAVLLCHRGALGCSRRALADKWGPARAQLVSLHREEIGFGAYMQVHRVSRLNLLYNLILLSRSWPVSTAFSVLHGLPVSMPRLFDMERKAEAWDVIEVFEFPDAGAAQAFLEGDAAAGARAALTSDAESWTRRRHAVPMQVTRAHAGGPPVAHEAFNVYCLRARPHLGRTAMIDYWLRRHRPYVLRLQPILRFGLYDQQVARGTDELEDAAAGMSHGAGAAWDGVAVLGYRRMADIWRGLASARVQAANIGLVWDETRFVDVARSSFMLGRVRHRL